MLDFLGVLLLVASVGASVRVARSKPDPKRSDGYNASVNITAELIIACQVYFGLKLLGIL